MPSIFLAAPAAVFLDAHAQTVHNNTQITSSGEMVFLGLGVRNLVLVINIKNAPTGTNPTLQYFLQEVDPGDKTTLVGVQTSSQILTSSGTQALVSIPLALTGAVRVSWLLSGSSPRFTGVYATLVTRNTSPSTGLDSAGIERSVITTDTGILKVHPDLDGTVLLSAPITISASGDTTVVAGSSGQKIKVMAYSVQSQGTVDVKFKDNATDLTGVFRFNAREGTGLSTSHPSFLFSTAVGAPLILNLSASVAVQGFITYWIE